MPQIVELDGGVELEFPDGLTSDQIGEAVDHYHSTLRQEPSLAPAASASPTVQPSAVAENESSFMDYIPLVSQARDVMDVASQGFQSSDQFPYFALPDSVGDRKERRDVTTDIGAMVAAPSAGTALLGVGKGVVGGALKGAGASAIDAGLYSALLGSGDVAGDATAGAAAGGVVGGTLGRIIGGKVAPALADGAQEAADLGIRTTRAQATGSLPAHIAEESARQNSITGGKLREFAANQQGDIQRVIDEIVPGGGATGDLAEEGIQALGEARKLQKQAVRSAYKVANETGGRLSVDSFGSLLQRMGGEIDEFAGFNAPMRAQLSSVTDQIEAGVSAAAEKGQSIKFGELEGLRKGLSSAIRTAKGQEQQAYKAGLLRLRSTFDNWADDVVDSAAFSGDQTALDAIKGARGLHAQYMSRFGERPGDAGGKIIAKILDEDVTDGVNFLFGAGKLGLNGTGAAMRRIKASSPEAYQAFRRAAWNRIANDAQGELKSAGHLSNALKKQLESQPELMKETFGAQAVGQMEKLTKALGTIQTPKDALNPSRSGWAILRGLQGMIGVGGIASGSPELIAAAGAGTVRDLMTSRNAMRPLGSMSESAALGAQDVLQRIFTRSAIAPVLSEEEAGLARRSQEARKVLGLRKTETRRDVTKGGGL